MIIITLFIISCQKDSDQDTIIALRSDNCLLSLTDSQATSFGEAHNNFISDHFVSLANVFRDTDCDPCYDEYENYLDTVQLNVVLDSSLISQSLIAQQARETIEKLDSINFDITNYANTKGRPSLNSFYLGIDTILNGDDIDEWDLQFVKLKNRHLKLASCTDSAIIKGVVEVSRHSTCIWKSTFTNYRSQEIMVYRNGKECVNATVGADATTAAFWLEYQSIGMSLGWAAVPVLATPGIGQTTFVAWAGMGALTVGGGSLWGGINAWWNGPGGNGGPAPEPTSNEDCPPE